jgi:hypothetical protein
VAEWCKSLVRNIIFEKFDHTAVKQPLAKVRKGIESLSIALGDNSGVPATKSAELSRLRSNDTLADLESLEAAELERFVEYALAISIFLGLLTSLLNTNDLLYTLLRCFRVTKRTSYDSLWLETFYDHKGSYVEVEIADGRRLRGYPRSFSDALEEGALFLENAAWLKDSDDGSKVSEVKIDGPGILLTKNAEPIVVTFLTTEIQEEQVFHGDAGHHQTR